MPCYFDEKNLKYLNDEFAGLAYHQGELSDRIGRRIYRSDLGSEYANHGLLRRVKSLNHAIHFTFENIPPELEAPPTDYCLENAKMAAQSFYVNIFGAIDNIAWIWQEKNPCLVVTEGLSKEVK